MKKPTLFDDLREIKEGWHDPAFRKGFISSFWPAFLKSFLLNGFAGVLIGYTIARLLS
ncbi:hypothetical protein [Sphingomonas sp.]|jgi:hypothetical protein|uniref:hypothetical protein n=1 Tax=Sphingomonas sp. TaxID=28214 RepID=UPI003D6C7A6C